MSQIIGKGHRSQPANKIEAIWDELLSRQPERVLAVYRALEQPEREAVIAHLQRMVAEPGWQPEQRASAQAAIRALKNLAE
jgi:hypothetical protein